MKKATRRDNGKRNIVGQNIRKVRLEKGVTQQKLSEMLKTEGIHLDQKIISAIECRLRTVADFELLAIAKCLEVHVDVLFED